MYRRGGFFFKASLHNLVKSQSFQQLASTENDAPFTKTTFDLKGRIRILDFAKRANFQRVLKIVLYSIRISDISKSNGEFL